MPRILKKERNEDQYNSVLKWLSNSFVEMTDYYYYYYYSSPYYYSYSYYYTYYGTIFIFISAGRKICFVIKTPCSGESEVGVVWPGRRSGRYYHIEEKNGVPATTRSQSPPRDRQQQQIAWIKQLCNIWSRISPALHCQLMSIVFFFFDFLI